MSCDNCAMTEDAHLALHRDRWFDTETHQLHEGLLCDMCVSDGLRNDEGLLYLN